MVMVVMVMVVVMVMLTMMVVVVVAVHEVRRVKQACDERLGLAPGLGLEQWHVVLKVPKRGVDLAGLVAHHDRDRPVEPITVAVVLGSGSTGGGRREGGVQLLHG